MATGLSAMMVAMAVPSLRSLKAPYAGRSAATQVATDLQAARTRAIARNARYKVIFGSSSYTLNIETSPGTFTQDGATQQLPVGTSIGTVSPGNPIFTTQGMLAAAVTIPVSSNGGRTRTVTANVLGQTTIQ